MTEPSLYVGNACALDSDAPTTRHTIPVHHLTTHGIVVGASGTGKTGALIVLLEEAARSGVPTLVIDVKGDMPNLGLVFPDFAAASVKPWVQRSPGDKRSVQQIAEAQAVERQKALEAWGIGLNDLQAFADKVDVRLITPGHTSGEPLHVLSALEHPAGTWDRDPEGARASISAAISLVLRLIGRDPDAARSRDHALLSVLVERRMRLGLPSDLGALLQDLLEPPIQVVGSLPIDNYVSAKARGELAASLNTLLASPTFVNWRQGAPLRIGEWLAPAHQRPDGKTPMVIVSVAHLDDDDRTLVLGVLLEEVLSWVRGLPGTQELRALLVFDEVYGYIPPHPAKPPTKQPLMLLLKQARAFGVGVILATQNPMDIEYRVLSNASLWCVARLQTDADRNRVVEAMSEHGGVGSSSPAGLAQLLKQLENRWFVMRNLRAKKEGMLLVQPRWAMSYLRGPLTPNELRQVRVRLNGGKEPLDVHTVPIAGSGEYPSAENTLPDTTSSVMR